MGENIKIMYVDKAEQPLNYYLNKKLTNNQLFKILPEACAVARERQRECENE